MFKTRTENDLLLNFNGPPYQQKLSHYLNDALIANMMINPELFTNSFQNFYVLREILIPTLSNSFNSVNKSFNAITYRHLQFQDLLKQEINDSTTDVATENAPNDSTFPLQRGRQPSFNINLKKVPNITDIKSLISFVSPSVPLPLKFFKKYVTSLSPIEDQIFQIYDTFSNSLDFLFNCYLWGIATGSVELLLKTAYSSFLLSINDTRSQKVKSIKYDSDFCFSFRSEPAFSIQLDRRTGFINLSDYILRTYFHRSTFCVSNDHIFLINANSILTDISLSESLTDRAERFVTTKNEQTQSRIPPVIAVSNGYLFVGCDTPLIYSIDPFKMIQSNPSYLPKSAPHIKAPASSDGFYIYSLLSKSELATFSIEGRKINHIRTVKLKMGNSPLLIPHNEKLVSKKWLKNATTVTDGFTFRIIIVDGEPGRFQHFIRSFSLIDGMHIGDQKIVYQFYIHSITYDVYSNSYYVLTPYSEGSQIMRFDNTGPKPPWTANISFNTFPINQSLQKVFDSSYVKASSLSTIIFTIFQYFTIPLMGCETNSPAVNQVVLNYLAPASKSDEVIQMVIESIAAMNTNTSHMLIDLKQESIEIWMKTLLILLSLNISRYDLQFNHEETQKIISILSIILMKQTCYRQTVFFLLINNFEKLFENCPELISDSFAPFQSDLTKHELMLLNNLSKSKLFPYLFSEQMYLMFYTTRIQRIRKAKNADSSELIFIQQFQHSLFTHEENDLIIKYCVALSSGMIEQMIFLLKELESPYNDEELSSNTFIQIYRKFLLLIQLKLTNFSLIKSLTQFIYPLMKGFTECLERLQITDTNSFLFQCFIESFDMCISFFQGMISSKFDLSKTNKFIHIIQTISHFFTPSQNDDSSSSFDLVELNLEKLNLNLNLDDAFNNKFPKITKNLDNFMNFYYENIKNPMNKNIAKEEKIFEAQFLIILANLMKVDVFANEVNPQVRKLVQVVYKIRGDLKSSKQMTVQRGDDSKPTEKITDQYPLYLNQIKEKVAFLTYINFDFLEEQVQLNELSGFISNEMSLADFFKISSQIQSSCSKFKIIFKPFLEIIRIPNFLIQFFSHLFQKISNDSSFLEALDAMSLFGEKDDLQEIFFELIKYVGSNDSNSQVPIPAFLSFFALIILIISKNKQSTDKIYIAISLLFEFICKNATPSSNKIENENNNNDNNNEPKTEKKVKHKTKSTKRSSESIKAKNNIDNDDIIEMKTNDNDDPNEGENNDQNDYLNIDNTRMFYTCFTFLCYFLRTLFDMKIIEYSEEQMKKIQKCFQMIPLSYSFSFMISHSMMHAGFEPKVPIENILVLLDTISVHDFHSYCLLLYEYILREDKRVETIAYHLLDEIGSILTGCECSLLNESLPLKDISLLFKEKSNESSCYIRTPQAQINACYELILLFRRLLLTDTNASHSIQSLFSEIINSFVDSSSLNDSLSVKRLIAVCSVISNTINSFIPLSFVKNKSNNQKFYISEMFNDWLVGISLPITGILNFSFISTKNSELEPLYFLNFAPSMFYDKETEEKLYHYALNIKAESYSSSLVSFFVLNCLRERIFDSNTGEWFAHDFIRNMKQLKADGFEYRLMNDHIISLIKKFLKNPDKGVFKSSSSKLSFHHYSFAKLAIEDDYTISNTHITSKKATNFFITDILDINKPISFAVLVGPRQIPNIFFGLFTHSIKMNHCFSILYNSTERGVLINGQESIIFENQRQIIEFRFDPINKKILLTSSCNNSNPLISMRLNDIYCSFVAILPENSMIEYYLGPTAQTSCFKNETSDKQENASINIQLNRTQDQKENENEVFKLMKPKYVYSNVKKEENKEKTPYYTIHNEVLNAANSNSILQPMIGSKDKILEFYQYKTSKLIPTILPIASSSIILYYSSKDSNVWSSSTNINNTFLSIENYDGYFESVKIKDDELKISKMIKSFYYENLTQMPIDLINSYINGLSDVHRCEIITQLIIRAISDKEIPIQKALSLFSLDYNFFLNFVIKMLVIIEPFNALNIKEGRSPIDFDFNSIISRCTKSSFFDHHAAVCKILKSDIINNKKEFFYFWYKRLLKDFNSKSLHFVTKNNTDYAIIQRGIKQETKEISFKNAIGYLVFPIEFGLRRIPKIQLLNSNEQENEYETDKASPQSSEKSTPNNSSNATPNTSTSSTPNSSPNRRSKTTNSHSKSNSSPKEKGKERDKEDEDEKENVKKENETENKDEFVTYSFIEGDVITITDCESKVAFLPVYPSNLSLTNSFIELVINFKYLIYFLNDCMTSPNLFTQKEIMTIKIELRKQIFNAITSGSPFFYTHDIVLLKFLNDHLPLSVSDFTEEYVKVLNVFSITSHTIPHPEIQNFIQEQSLLFDDHKAEAYRSFFPEFCDPNDINANANPNSNEPFKMPPVTLPTILNRYDPSTRATLLSVKRILKPRDSIVNFPFHLVINEWAYFYAIYPPTEIRIDTPCSITIQFTRYIPEAVRVIDRDIDLVDTTIEYSYSQLFTDSKPGSLLDPIPLKGEFLLIKFKITENVSQHDFIVTSALLPTPPVPLPLSQEQVDKKVRDDPKKPVRCSFFVRRGNVPNEKGRNNLLLSPNQVDLEAVVSQNRDKFIADMSEMILQWNKRDDQQILVHVKPEFFYRNNISPFIDPLELASIQSNATGQRRRANLLALRSMLLIDFNWLCAQFKEAIGSGGSFHEYRQFISMLISVSNFNALVEEKSTSGTAYANLRINRRAGLEVRSGVSKRLDQSMIAQFAAQYRSPQRFRSIKRPFHIEYVGENGIDVGGLARDFASELAKDICEHRVGLFVATPNARNKIGSFRECLVPSPDARIKSPGKLYRAVGGLIAIGVRSKIVQPFNFPPFFWHYLAGEPIKVENVYEVDEVFCKVISGLESAIEKGMEPVEFDRTFGNMKASFINFRGEEVNILALENNGTTTATTSGSAASVLGYMSSQRIVFISHKNVRRFIALSHEYRIRELEAPMKEINEGFWENLNFKHPPYVSAELLEFVVCGERQIDLRQLRNVTSFAAVSKKEIAMFWAALGRMNSEQRRNFLQFATGNMCMPQNVGAVFLTVEYVDAPVDKRLPAASTCFNRIHLPPYSSVEKMLRALITAIEYTGTFENS